MKLERTLRGLAGFFLLLSLGLGSMFHQIELGSLSWLWMIAFIGFNLLQSAFSNWCPMMAVLKKLGLE